MKIELQGADNARNFMGIKNSEGQRIVSGRYIRSNHLHNLSEEDIEILTKECDLKLVIDLRTGLEAEQKPDTEMKGVKHVHIPLFDESAIGITHEAGTDMQAAGLADIPDMAQLYVRMVTDEYSVLQISKVLNTIIENEEGAVLWHCTEGKDRCGIISALFLSILNVDRETVTGDYLTTNIAAGRRSQIFYENIVRITGDVEKALEVKEAFMANRNYLDAAFNAILKEYPTVQDYIEKKLSISKEQMNKLKIVCMEGM